ncbi:hypothetical protein DEI92_14920 [Curtobacterium sp. MCBD17_034]|nr:hypothetical protein DEI92_14920 [Curtobacterium sp. MCBD17_034]PZM33273.1 hypothetical protein DEI90_13400 [Curtobacterium sp. MCBD17_031]
MLANPRQERDDGCRISLLCVKSVSAMLGPFEQRSTMTTTSAHPGPALAAAPTAETPGAAETVAPDEQGVRARPWSGLRVHPANDTVAAFPLGGIGTGNVSVGARGEFRDWEIANHPDKGTWLPFTFFALRAAVPGRAAVTRVLESRLPGPHEGDSGYHIGKVAGLPRFAGSAMRGEYPLLRIDLTDDAVPVDVEMTAFTPLVPLDVDASGLPGAVIRYQVHNPLDTPVEVSVAGSMSNPIGHRGHDMFQAPVVEGIPTVTGRREPGLTGLVFGTDLPPEHPLHGSAVLATTDADATMTEQWPVDRWQDGVQLFWDDFTEDGRLEPPIAFTLEDETDVTRLPRQRVGSLAVAHVLAPGETHAFEFLLTWHVPNRPRAWQGNCGLPNTHEDQVVRNHYATRHTDAWAVAEHLTGSLEALERDTVAFHDALFDSTLPPEVVDAVSSTLVALRSTTCLLLDDGSGEGRFAAWEGSFDHVGSCEGTCTHVWNYAQTVANLFPSLERSARRTEFLDETLPDGRMRFRTNAVFGNDPHEFHPAVDGQMGTIVRLYREWRFSGDDGFLTELWPAAQLALEFAFRTWDANGDGVLDSEQHNTYDIEFHGENSLANSMFFAALRAAAAMAEHLGDQAAVDRYREAAERGAERMDALLFNGEYYEQRTDDVDAHRYQYGTGCLSDQLFGQTLAHLAGLGHVLPEDHVRSAVRAVYEHNFRRGFADFHSVQRTYALDDDRGLLLCSWPRGDRPRIPFVYSDEVWSGIEYQVATTLVYEGLVDEALELVRAVRDRYDGRKRNPWNEVECGNHYARSMASWGVLLALTGTAWDATTGTLHLAPRAAAVRDGVFRCLVTTARGWGEVVVDDGQARLLLRGGVLDARSVTVDLEAAGRFGSGPVALAAGDVVELELRD